MHPSAWASIKPDFPLISLQTHAPLCTQLMVKMLVITGMTAESHLPLSLLFLSSANASESESLPKA
jgi:hypothetical protein